MPDDIIEEVVLAEKISLRDYLAMAAMGSMIDRLYPLAPNQKIADECYKIAEAMLERGKRYENKS